MKEYFINKSSKRRKSIVKHKKIKNGTPCVNKIMKIRQKTLNCGYVQLDMPFSLHYRRFERVSCIVAYSLGNVINHAQNIFILI